MTSAVIGKGVRVIGGGAFANNPGLTQINIPDSVTEIGNGAFENCGLSSVTLGSGLQTIGDNAFARNDLSNIDLPAGLRSIGSSAFANNHIGATVTRSGDSVSTSVLIRRDSNGVALPTIIFPDSLQSIGSNAFANNNLSGVTLPAGITSISDGAFASNRLTRVTIPAGITSIGGGAFAGNQIQSVTIPAGIRSVGSNVFSSRISDNRQTRETRDGSTVSNQNSPVTSITLPANVSDSDLRNYGFEANFITFYGGQNRAAGTYTKNGPIWARSTAGGID